MCFLWEGVLCVWEGVGRRKSVIWVSLVDFSQHECEWWSRSLERCLEKSINLMYIFSDILKAVRFHKWQVNLKWGYCNFQRKEQQLLSVCIFYLGGRELSFILHNSWTDVSTQVALNLSLGRHLLFLHESLNNSVSKVYSCWIIVCLFSKFQ